jgi:hypothetical protein
MDKPSSCRSRGLVYWRGVRKFANIRRCDRKSAGLAQYHDQLFFCLDRLLTRIEVKGIVVGNRPIVGFITALSRDQRQGTVRDDQNLGDGEVTVC